MGASGSTQGGYQPVPLTTRLGDEAQAPQGGAVSAMRARAFTTQSCSYREAVRGMEGERPARARLPTMDTSLSMLCAKGPYATSGPVQVTFVQYSEAEFSIRQVQDLAGFKALLSSLQVDPVTADGKQVVQWIAVQSFNRTVVELVARHVGVDGFVVDSVLNGGLRANFEGRGEYVSVVTRAVRRVDETIVNEQLSLLVTNANLVVSVAPTAQACFADVRLRIERGLHGVRGRGAGHLAIVLLDAVTAGYYAPLEVFGDRLEELEALIINNANTAVAQAVYAVKREISMIRRAIWPTREVWSLLRSSPHPAFGAGTVDRVHHAYENLLQVIEVIETYRDIATSLRDLNTTTLTFEMDKVMKILTLVQAIFVPLTFLSSVYGMNFKHGMWELRFEYGYEVFWVLCAFFTLFQVYLIKRFNWW